MRVASALGAGSESSDAGVRPSPKPYTSILWPLFSHAEKVGAALAKMPATRSERVGPRSGGATLIEREASTNTAMVLGTTLT